MSTEESIELAPGLALSIWRNGNKTWTVSGNWGDDGDGYGTMIGVGETIADARRIVRDWCRGLGGALARIELTARAGDPCSTDDDACMPCLARAILGVDQEPL